MNKLLLSTGLSVGLLAGFAAAIQSQQLDQDPQMLVSLEPYDIMVGNHWTTRTPADQYARELILNGVARKTNVVRHGDEWFVHIW
jgi:hypothetical protein